MRARIYRQERKVDMSSNPPLSKPIAPVKTLRPGTGRPLENKVRERMEQKFGHDFSKVRVHTGGEADRRATDLNALAYTFGEDIVFADNQFDPTSRSGERLLAHELSHVVQQGGGSMSQNADVPVSKPGDASEVEAEGAAEAVASGGVAHVSQTGGSVVHRYQSPDSNWWDKLEGDTALSLTDTLESIPLIGNSVSAVNAAAAAGAASLTTNNADRATYLGAAEDQALNAIPVLGNLRAMGQAKHNWSTVANDAHGVNPDQNLSSFDNWTGGGMQQFNKSVWDEFF